jgi:methyltransferase
MGLIRYLLLLAAVGTVRLFELGISRANRRVLVEQGAAPAPDPGFRWLVVVHLGVMFGSALEVRMAKRPWSPVLGIPMALVLLGSNLLRWWVIRTLAGHWNVRVMDSTRLGVVSDGPYRWIRHPNYVAIFLELLALPLLGGAWITALVGAIVHVWALRRRIAAEESVLLADPVYREAMAPKPRFIPSPFARRR